MNTKNKISNSMMVLGRILMGGGNISAQRWEKILSDARGSDEALLKSISTPTSSRRKPEPSLNIKTKTGC